MIKTVTETFLLIKTNIFLNFNLNIFIKTCILFQLVANISYFH